jgi:hypothetical protein
LTGKGRDQGSGIRNQESGIRNQESGIRNQKKWSTEEQVRAALAARKVPGSFAALIRMTAETNNDNGKNEQR